MYEQIWVQTYKETYERTYEHTYEHTYEQKYEQAYEQRYEKAYEQKYEQIVKDSKFCLTLDLSEIKETSDFDCKYYNQLKSLPINLDNICKFYESKLNFENNELLELINNLSYLDNIHLNSLLLFAKYQDLAYFQENLNEDLLRLYSDYELENNQFHHFIKIGSIFICKWLFKNTQSFYENKKDHEKGFLLCCEYGQFEILLWLYQTTNVNLKFDDNLGFLLACDNGHENIVKWLNNVGNINVRTHDNYGFVKSCSKGYLNLAKWFYEMLDCQIDEATYSDVFSKACEKGHYEIVVWLYEIDELFADDLWLNLDVCCLGGHLDILKFSHSKISEEVFNYQECILHSCYKGHLEMSKWLYEVGKHKINIHHENDEIFRYTTYNGHLNIIIWLYEISEEYSLDKQIVFNDSCRSGNLNLVKFLHKKWNDVKIEFKSISHACTTGNLELVIWLYENSSENINIHQDEEDLYIHACGSGNHNLVLWIYEKCHGIIDLNIQNQLGFVKCCRFGNLKTAKWIYDKTQKRIDIHPKNFTSFREACHSGHLDVLKWMYEICESKGTLNDIQLLINNYFRIPQKLDVIKWMYEMSDNKENLRKKFLLFFKDRNIQTMKWLYETDSEILQPQIYNALAHNIFHENIQCARWLYTLGDFKNLVEKDFPDFDINILII